MLLRQPQLLILLLVVPVLIMVAFALSFQDQNVRPRAVVVVEEGSEGEELFERFRGQFTERTRELEVLHDAEAADGMIENGETDAVIILPSDPSGAVARGERAPLEVRYSAINPIYGATVPNRSRGLILDLNRAILREGISQELESVRSLQAQMDELDAQLEQVESAAESLTGPEARATTGQLGSALADLETSLEVLSAATPENQQVSDSLEQTRQTRELLEEFQAAQEAGAEAILQRTGAAELDRELTELGEAVAEVPQDVPADVLVNPLRLDLENLAPPVQGAIGFYAPATLALLIQHIALSLASLALVRERLSGAYEYFDVSPLGAGELLAGKFITYAGLVLGVNLAVAAALLGLMDIPSRGGWWRLVAAMGMLTAASLAAGFLLSAVCRTRLQAIQVAMLSFIASGFFSGFLFPLEELDQPALAISRILPATYGIQALQDVMIRGQWPVTSALAGFAVIFVVCIVAARLLMGRVKS